MTNFTKTMAAVFCGVGLSAAVAFTPTQGVAESTPRAGNLDPRVRHVTYREGQVYRINTRVKHATLIVFDKGEVITTVPVGDSKSFLIEEITSKNALMVKPLISGARTNAIVETNRRFYLLQLYESGSRAPFYAVHFDVPQSAKPKRTVVPRSAVTMRYSIEQTKQKVAFKPTAVWDDGQKTHFSFGPDAPIPAVFRADEKGREYAVNSATNGTTITVPKRAEHWVLRHGDVFLCITGQTPEVVK